MILSQKIFLFFFEGRYSSLIKYVITLLELKTYHMDKTAVKIITYFNDIEEFLIGILFFTLPFGWTFSIVPLVLFSTTLLINIITKPEKPSKEKLLYFLPIISIFVWGAVTLLYSSDVKEGIETLTTQLVLFVAAIAFLFNRITATSVKKGFYMFLLGCLGSVAIMYGIAFYNSSSIIGDSFVFRPFFEPQSCCMLDTDTSGYYFLGKTFSSLVHPAYNALMLSMAMFIILHNVQITSTRLVYHGFWIACFALFGITIISFSLNGTLVLIIVIILLVLGILSIRKIHYGERSRTIYSILFIFAAMILINPQTKKLVDSDGSGSLEYRTKVTSATLNVIGENWLTGVGIGDSEQALFSSYTRRGEQELAHRKLNSHNQFLTSWLQGGLIGFLILIWNFVTVSIRAQKKKVMLLHLFNVMVIISFLFESMLMRYWGVITYTIFYGMLYFYTEEGVEDNMLDTN